MADKTPVRVVYNSSNVATGLAEFQSTETVGYAFGGTGLSSLGTAGQVLKVNAAGTAMEFGAEGDISITNLVAPSNSDLTLTTSGTGNIVLDGITVRGTTLSAADSSAININEGLIVDGTASVSGALSSATSLALATGATVTGILDEDAMGTDSATQLATQQSIKAYADTKAVLSGSTNNTIATVTGAHALVGESNLTFDGTTLTVTGNLTVTGTNTALETTTLVVEDPLLELAKNNSGGTANTMDQGLFFNRGSLSNVSFIWDESADEFVLAVTAGEDGTTSGNITIDSYAGLQVGVLKGTTGTFSTSLALASGATVTGILDEDAMGTDSATQLATQQSIKAYVDGKSHTSLSGSTNNTVATVTGANALAGEANLTFDGSTLAVTGAATISTTLTVTGATTVNNSLTANSLTTNTISSNGSNADLSIQPSGTGDVLISALRVNGTTIDSSDSSAVQINENTEVDGTLTVTGAVAITSGTITGITDLTVADGGTGASSLTDNAVLTGTGTSAITAEGNLSFNGSTLAVTGAATVSTTLGVTGATTLSGGATILGEVTAGSLTTNTIASNGSNADVNITPQGTGKVIVNNLSIDGELGNIISSSSNMDITFTPHGTGSVVVSQVKTNSVTGEVIPGKLEGTNFSKSLLVGHSTSGTLDTASNNTGIGIDTLDALTTADNNTAVGTRAGTSLTTGSENVVIGADSGKNLVSAWNNTAVGFQNLYTNQVGTNNVAIGDKALEDSTASNNTAVGSQALKEVSDSSYNIGLGRRAGDNITSGDGNVIIGSVDAASATGDRQLMITGYDGTTTTTWIKGTSAGAITFNSAYTFPTADGSDGQALVTDGSGTLTFGTVGSASASDDSLGIAISDKKITSTARTIDSFHSTFQDSVLYYVVSNDHYEDCVNIQKVSVTHNDTTAYCSSAGAQSKASTTMTAFTCDLSNDMVRLKAASSNAIGGSLSFYKFGLGDNSSAATSGNIIVSQNTDVDSAEESLVSFAHGTYRGAKLFVSVNNDAKTEVGNMEALVVHDGTTAYISIFGEINSGNNSLLTLTAAIDGSNVVVSAAGGEANLRVTVHAIMLKDTMVSDDGTYSNTEAIAPVTISSTATEVDTLVEASNNGAVYYLVSKNASEGHYAVNEVFMAMGSGEITVASGSFVSTKGTNQLAFTSDYKDDVENTGQLLCSSTSGGSTTVSAYRINCLAK